MINVFGLNYNNNYLNLPLSWYRPGPHYLVALLCRYTSMGFWSCKLPKRGNFHPVQRAMVTCRRCLEYLQIQRDILILSATKKPLRLVKYAHLPFLYLIIWKALKGVSFLPVSHTFWKGWAISTTVLNVAASSKWFLAMMKLTCQSFYEDENKCQPQWEEINDYGARSNEAIFMHNGTRKRLCIGNLHDINCKNKSGSIFLFYKQFCFYDVSLEVLRAVKIRVLLACDAV
jgi:hypothetical protein